MEQRGDLPLMEMDPLSTYPGTQTTVSLLL